MQVYTFAVACINRMINWVNFEIVAHVDPGGIDAVCLNFNVRYIHTEHYHLCNEVPRAVIEYFPLNATVVRALWSRLDGAFGSLYGTRCIPIAGLALSHKTF
jgi:hypothetical protein